MGKHFNGRNFDWDAFKRGNIPRICQRCKLPVFVDQFCQNAGGTSGFGKVCKNCAMEKHILGKLNKEENTRSEFESWIETNPSENTLSLRETWNRYRVENAERIREKDRRWRENNREYDKQRKRESRQRQPWQNKKAVQCNKRALDKGVPRGMEGYDLLDPRTGKLPEYCPIFPHIKLDYNQGQDRRYHASVDRKVPELGYTSGNVWVVSMAANTWKSNGSSPEERAIISKMMAPKKPAPKIHDDQISLF